MYKAIIEPCRDTSFRINLLTLIILFCGLLLSTAGQAADSVGVLKFARGNVSIVSSSDEIRKAVKDDILLQNELVVTGAASIAVIQLNDNSRMTLRPHSEFRVDLLNTDNESNDSNTQQSAVLNLLRGGLRLVTGLIGRINPLGYQLITPVATIGIRGTEFNTRICTTDCAAEEKQLAGNDAAEKINEGLYVSVDEGQIFLDNNAAGETLELKQGESGYVSDLNSLPVKLSQVPAFQSMDKIPSPSRLDFDNIEIPDDVLQAFGSLVAALPIIESEPEVAEKTIGIASKEEEVKEWFGISGTYDVEVNYGADLYHGERIRFFGSDPDILFTLKQEDDKFTGEFIGDREGTIKGRIDGDEVTYEFLLEARGGEIKDGVGTWIVQEDGSLKGDFKIRDSKRGIVFGSWILTRVQTSGGSAFELDILLILIIFSLMVHLTGMKRRKSLL